MSREELIEELEKAREYNRKLDRALRISGEYMDGIRNCKKIIGSYRVEISKLESMIRDEENTMGVFQTELDDLGKLIANKNPINESAILDKIEACDADD